MNTLIADILCTDYLLFSPKFKLLGLEKFTDILGDAGRDGESSRLNENGNYNLTKSTKLYTGRGDDLVVASDSNDYIFGGKGNDVVFANGGNDYVFGGRGDDILMGNGGSDFIDGGWGNDFLIYSISENFGSFDFYEGGRGHDTLMITADFKQYLQYYSEMNSLLETKFIAFDNNQVLLTHSIESVDVILTERVFRTVNGTYNNADNSHWGSTDIQLIRLAPNAYEDGISIPRGGFEESRLPSVRAISNAVAAQSGDIFNEAGATDWFWQWGQFIDHDIDITEGNIEGETFNINVPEGDKFFDPYYTGTKEIGLTRSIYDPSTGTSENNPRQQINQITAYLDASMVYGSDQERADALRVKDGSGKLSTSIGTNGEFLLPYNTDGLGNAGGDSDTLFLAGDVRANEQVGLTAVHTLFVREHNRLAELFSSLLDTGDETITKLYDISGLSEGDFFYEASRRVVGAEIQSITYNEFLPLLLGNDGLDPYSGYDPTVNASITNEFSTAAYRFGHTMLSPFMQDGTEDGIALQDAFFNPSYIEEKGIEGLLLGLASQQAQEIDNFVIDDVRNFLFGPPGAGGFDLASLNIQRGRDHGLASYNDTRVELGFDTVDDFDDITRDVAIQAALASVYSSVDEVDLWVGGLAEDSLTGSMLGATFSEIISDQFERLRDGDSFYYEDDIWLAELDLQVLGFDMGDSTITDVSLGDIIGLNSSLTPGVDIHNDVFIYNEPPTIV